MNFTAIASRYVTVEDEPVGNHFIVTNLCGTVVAQTVNASDINRKGILAWSEKWYQSHVMLVTASGSIIEYIKG